MGYIDNTEFKERIKRFKYTYFGNLFITNGEDIIENKYYIYYDIMFKSLVKTLIKIKDDNIPLLDLEVLNTIKLLKDLSDSSVGLKEAKDFYELIKIFINIHENGIISNEVNIFNNIDLSIIYNLYIKEIPIGYLRRLKIEQILNKIKDK